LSPRRRRLAIALAALVAFDLVIAGAVAVVLGLVSGDETGQQHRPGLPAFVEPEKRGLAPTFGRAARESRLPVALVEALAWRESRWRAEAYNPSSGTTGIGQLLPDTAAFVARELLHDPTLDPAIAVDNIRLTARYLRALVDRFDGSVRKGLAAYLQGSTSVTNDGISPTTAAYLEDIAKLRRRFDQAARGRAGSPHDPLSE
jgi:soluble lytic murein transglycosylase-like protein